LLLVLLLLILFFSVQTKGFRSYTTVSNLANQIPPLTLLAVGMTFVLIVAGIDLSVGSVLGLGSAMLGVTMVYWGLPLWLALPICLAAGCLCGAINGTITVSWAIPSFIVTLGMMQIARGAAQILTDSGKEFIGADVLVISAPLPWVGISPAFLIAIAAVVLGELLLHRTVFGRHAIAIGGNEQAARLSGIRTGQIKIAIFAISGTLATLAGIISASKNATADPGAGGGDELYAIAAAVIGGTSLMGGRGSVVTSFLGVLIIAVLHSGLAAVGFQHPYKLVIIGSVIIVAAIIDAYRRRLARTG
jgi:ribose transport system permease protein